MTTSKNTWIIQGLVYGAMMYLVLEVLWPLIQGEEVLTTKLIYMVPIWTILGLVFGYLMKVTSGKRD